MEHVKKKILLLSSGDINGAYEYIYRLAKLLHVEGHQVAMLVKKRTKTDSFIIQYIENKPYKRKTILERVYIKIKNKFFKKRSTPKPTFDPNYDFISVDETTVNVSPAEIVNLIGFNPELIFTGMTDNFMNSTDLLNLQQLSNAEVYNITVDMNHFTGGCHFAWDCKGYIEGCNECPAITSSYGKDLAKINFETKLENSRKGKFKILTGSGWTMNQAKESLIYKNQSDIVNINSLIDINVFNNKSRSFAKQIFNLEDNNFYILMGCQNANAKRKGFEYLLDSLKILYSNLNQNQRSKIKVLIVSKIVSHNFDEIPFDKQHIDYINDYRLLSLLYQATDVFVNSSIEDSGPMMVSEALACGTPVVGFDMGVVTNMVVNGYNGYKAINKDAKDLAKGIEIIFNLTIQERKQYIDNASKQVESYSSLESASRLLNDILFKNQ
jgi:glycosyltransferase involved in cell wall biosynthesis